MNQNQQHPTEIFPGQFGEWQEVQRVEDNTALVDVVYFGPRGEKIPELWEFKAKPLKKLGPMDRFPNLSWLFPGLLFLFAALAVSLWSWGGAGIELATSGQGVFQRNNFYQLFTALLAHGSIEHFLSNALPLLVFSWLLSGYFGLWFFPVFPIVIGVLSNLVTVSLYAPSVRLLGASGMVYGMVALWLVLFLKFNREQNWAIKFMRTAGFVMLLLLPSQYEQNVSYLAHASGFAVGMGTGFVALPFVTVPEVKAA